MVTLLPLLLVPFLFTRSFAQDASALAKDLTSKGIDTIFPEDIAYYNATRSFNTRLVVQPFAIAYVVGAKQVSDALLSASGQGLDVVARSGGHSYIGNSLGGKNGSFVLDLSKNTALSVDPKTGIATIEPGLRLGEVVTRLDALGRAMPHGRCTHVGIGGHSTHGGWGWQSREWGALVDVVQKYEVVLSDGRIVNASSSENQDLFWAMRGSGSSYGIMTKVYAKTFPKPQEHTGFTYDFGSLSIQDAVHALSTLQSFSLSGIPSQLGFSIRFSPGAAEGQVSTRFIGSYIGSFKNFNATVKPYLSAMPPANGPDTKVVQGTWVEGFAAGAVGLLDTSIPETDIVAPWYMKSVITPQEDLMTSEAMTNWVTFMANDGHKASTSILPFWWVEVELYGGSNSAMNKVAADKTAFAHRHGLFNLNFAASSLDPSGAFPDSGYTFLDNWANAVLSAEPNNWKWSAYIGYTDARLPNGLDFYYPNILTKLKTLKKKYDPKDLFSFPLSIPLA